MAEPASTRYRKDWRINTRDDGYQIKFEEIQIVLLQEIRDELKRLNILLTCRNFTQIPTTLRAIDRELKTIRKAQAKEGVK